MDATDFNNMLAVWTAFQGEIKIGPPFVWRKMFASNFGFANADYMDAFSIYTNGKAFNARASKSASVSYYDTKTRRWVNTNPDTKIAGLNGENGLYLGNRDEAIYTSADGVTWRYVGSCYGMAVDNVIDTSTNGTGGIICDWSVATPLYYRTSLIPSAPWTLVKTLTFTNMLCHKNRYFCLGGMGYPSNPAEMGIYTSSTGATWTRMMQFPHGVETGTFSALKSVGGKLFAQTYTAEAGSDVVTDSIGIVNDTATEYVDVFTITRPRDEPYTARKMPNFNSLLYVDSLKQFMLFDKNVAYVSTDGIAWTAQPQEHFAGYESGKKGFAMYIPNDGIYVKDDHDSNYVWYAPCL